MTKWTAPSLERSSRVRRVHRTGSGPRLGIITEWGTLCQGPAGPPGKVTEARSEAQEAQPNARETTPKAARAAGLGRRGATGWRAGASGFLPAAVSEPNSAPVLLAPAQRGGFGGFPTFHMRTLGPTACGAGGGEQGSPTPGRGPAPWPVRTGPRSGRGAAGGQRSSVLSAAAPGAGTTASGRQAADAHGSPVPGARGLGTAAVEGKRVWRRFTHGSMCVCRRACAHAPRHCRCAWTC